MDVDEEGVMAEVSVPSKGAGRHKKNKGTEFRLRGAAAGSLDDGEADKVLYLRKRASARPMTLVRSSGKEMKKAALEPSGKADRRRKQRKGGRKNGLKRTNGLKNIHGDVGEEKEGIAEGVKKRKRNCSNNDKIVAVHDKKTLIGQDDKINFSNYQKNEVVHKRKMLTGEDALMCHQCQRNDKGDIVRCQACKRKRYCYPCIKRWYPHLKANDFAIKCPFCRFNCNCKLCLRMMGITAPRKRAVQEREKIQHALYVLRLLLPWFKDFRKEQNIEKEIEAAAKGLALSKIKIQEVPCEKDERVYCNYCSTSLADFHRSCSSCSYDLCISCCRDLRAGFLPGQHVQQDSVSTDFADVRAAMQWKSNADGSIPCPPKEMGGCGSSILHLKCMFSEDLLLEMELKANKILKPRSMEHGSPPHDLIRCSCLYALRYIDFGMNTLRKAASREGSDNYLYCPSAKDTQSGDLQHFRGHWVKGEPVDIRDVLDLTSGLSWEPMVMWRALR